MRAIKPLSEMSWSELFELQEDCIVWLMENTSPDKKWREMQRLKSAIKSEVYSRESSNKSKVQAGKDHEL